MFKWRRVHPGVFETCFRKVLPSRLDGSALDVQKNRSASVLKRRSIKNIYGQDCTGRNPTDRGRLATKLSAIVDDTGVPVSLYLCPGNVSDHKTVQPTLDCRIGRLDSHIPLYADKGYDSKDTRQKIRNAKYIDRVGKRRIWTHRIVNRKRGVVERFFSWLDKYRRLILRYDALISSYESMTWLAACRFVSAIICLIELNRSLIHQHNEDLNAHRLNSHAACKMKSRN